MNEKDAYEEMRRQRPDILQWLKELGGKGVLDAPEAVTSEELVVVLAGFGSGGVDDSQPRLCHACGRTVIVAPSTQELLRKRTGPIELICPICFVKKSKEGIS